MTDHLARLCFDGAASFGWYTPHSFSVRLLGTELPTDHVVYLHEVHHAALNDVTAWGSALHIFARLPDAATEFRALLDACRTTHESMATYASVQIATARHGALDDVLATYPDYVSLYDATARLAAGVDGPNRRQLIVTALARLCLQTPVLDALVAAGTDGFELAQVRHLDRPDGRWAWFTRQGPDALSTAAAAADRAVVIEFGPGAIECDGPECDLYRSTDRTHDVAWSVWEATSYEHLRVVLTSAGAATLSFNGHQSATAAVLAMVRERHGDLGLRAAMNEEQVIDDAAIASSVLQQVRHQLSEPDRYRAVRLPSSELASVVDALADRPVIDGRPALVVDARPASRLTAQYGWLDATPDLGAPGGPVVAVRLFVEADGPDEVIGHLVLPDPASLHELVRRWAGRDHLLSCVSASCLADTTWTGEWLGPLRAAGPLFVLVDVEPDRFVPGWARDGRDVIAVGVEVSDTAGERSALLVTADQGRTWWLVVANDVTVRLMGEYLRGQLGDRLRSDLELFQRIRSDATVVITHLLATESFVSFDTLGNPHAS